MPSIDQSQGLQLSYETIAEMADVIAKSTGIRSIGDFEPIVTGMGGKVERVGAKAWSSPAAPSLDVKGPKNFTAYLSQGEPALDRLLLACALGHYILHSAEGRRPQIFKRFAKDARSVEALWFGMSIIIADEAFALAEQHGDLDDIVVAGLFQTTPELIALKRKLRLAARKARERAAQPLA